MNSPFGQAHRLAIERDVVVAPRVSHLCGAICPSTIVGAISAVVVDSIQFTAEWSRSHIGHKSREIIPLLAHENAPSAIGRKVLVFGVAATLTHSSPYRVLRGAPSISSSSVLGYGFNPEASTTTRVTANEVGAMGHRFSAALTEATPDHETTLSSLRCGSHRSQASELHAGKIAHRVYTFYRTERITC